MKSFGHPLPPENAGPTGFPGASEIAALRAWYKGLDSVDAVRRYLPEYQEDHKSSRATLTGIRRQLASFAAARQQQELATLFKHRESARAKVGPAALRAIEVLRHIPVSVPEIGDPVRRWLPVRIARVLEMQGIKTLADLTVRIPRRKMWWSAIVGLGAAGARKVEIFFAAHPELTAHARELVLVSSSPEVVPWESLVVPSDVDGRAGTFRAPRDTCSLAADNDYQAVQAWLSLYESGSTLRAYRKEAERLILWAIFERGRALSSLTVEDAVAYRAFLRHPAPGRRWVGPARPRTAADWKPFAGDLSARSVAYALTVLKALFRWLMEQGYLLANPFSGVKVRGTSNLAVMDTSHVFTEGEWAIVRAVADGLEWSYGWTVPAAQRLRFVLDFGYSTGLRASELVGVTLKAIRVDAHDDHWLHLVGKGAKAAKVALPPLARNALTSYLVQRGLPTTPHLWRRETALVGALGREGQSGGITATRLWMVMRRFFLATADRIEADSPALAEKLRLASPHWLRHTHATHALANGVELTTVRDNLRHASISTTSVYLHTDDLKRARQIGDAFATRS